jgi:hypothetical protein
MRPSRAFVTLTWTRAGACPQVRMRVVEAMVGTGRDADDHVT